MSRPEVGPHESWRTQQKKVLQLYVSVFTDERTRQGLGSLGF